MAGQPAPADGIWYSPELAAAMLVAAEQSDKLVASERRRADRRIAAEKAIGERNVKIEQEAAERATTFLMAEIERASPWYKSPAFVAPLVVTAVFAVELVLGLLLAEYSKFVASITGSTR